MKEMKNFIKKTVIVILVFVFLIQYQFPMQVHAAYSWETSHEIKNQGVYGININIDGSVYRKWATWAVNNGFASSFPYGPLGCTWYVTSRVQELGYNVNSIRTGSSWYNSYAANLGYQTAGSGTDINTINTPALACFANHVEVIEAVNSDGSIIISTGGDASGNDYNGHCKISKVSNSSSLANNTTGALLGYVLLNGYKSATTPVVYYDSLYTDWVNSTNAKIHGVIHNPQRLKVEKVAVAISDAATGQEIHWSSENCGSKLATINQWYDITGELNVTLTPGHTYYFGMAAYANGQWYNAPTGSFTTTN